MYVSLGVNLQPRICCAYARLTHLENREIDTASRPIQTSGIFGARVQWGHSSKCPSNLLRP